jgi:CBS domain-containing protein
VTRAVYAVEHIFEKLPIHWAFWPAIGAVAVGVVGFFEPHALGVGYDNIQHFLLADMAVRAVATLCILKFIAWVISLGSGTSGGTLAPLFTVGGGLGLVLGSLAASALPSWGIDPRVAALVGMAAMFAGASRALLASVVFAFETTRQPMGLLPLLGGCTAAYVVSYAMMHYSIMTRKIASRGVVVPHEYTPDLLDHAPVLQHTSKDVVTFGEDLSLEEARAQASTADEALASRGFAVVTVNGTLTALLTRDELRASSQPSSTPLRRLVVGEPTVLPEEALLRDAVEAMLTENVARLAVVSRDRRLLGVVTRHDVLLAYRRRWAEEHAERASSFLVRSKAGASRAALRDT